MANTLCLFKEQNTPGMPLGSDISLPTQGAKLGAGDRVLMAGAAPKEAQDAEEWIARGFFRWLVLGKVISVSKRDFVCRIGAIYQSLPFSTIERSALQAIMRSASLSGAPVVVGGLASVKAPTQISRAKERTVELRTVRANAWEREFGAASRRARVRWRLGKSPASKD